MDTTQFIEAFRSLPTKDGRQHACEALLAELTPYEWRALHALTAARSFQFDIVGHLPLELLAQVFSYLDVAHPYRLQCVSRTWYRGTRSLVVLKLGLTIWYQGTVDLRHADYGLCTTMAKTIQAFRTGRPRSHCLIRLDQSVEDSILSADTLIWMPRTSKSLDTVTRSICVMNLSSWTFRQLRGEERERVYSVVASRDIVAIVTYTNTFYAWELHGNGSHKCTLPSRDYIDTVACRERTIAFAALKDDHMSVFIWQFDTQRGQSFQISRYLDEPCLGISTPSSFARQSPLWLLLQPRTSTIIVIASTQYSADGPNDPRNAANGPIVSSRLTFDGECLDRSILTLPERYCSIRRYLDYQLVPINHQGRFMAIAACRLTDKADLPEVVNLEFDEDSNQFITTGDRTWSLASSSWWNDTFCHKDTSRTWTGRSITTTIGNTSGFSRTLETCERLEDEFDSVQTLVNGKYIVRDLYRGFAVLCFDQSNDCLDEHGQVFEEGEVVPLEYSIACS